jgi:glycosyltransferase involved in cell wall biosynthesis
VPAEARVILGLAKFNEREAPWDLLRAFSRVQDPDVWLVLAGDGPARPALDGFARQLSRVRFPGYVPYPDLPTLYAASDLFVHAAREERWGVSVQEALACGLPVVASSRVGAGYDLIEVGSNGFVYPAGDDAMLAHRIGEALALDRARARERSADILDRWDYASTWSNLLSVARRLG